MQQVIITIAPDGSPTIKVNGVPGKSCKDVTKTVERALGSVTSDKPTQEMALPPMTHNTISH
jgi:hypothetical protein